MSTTVTVNEPDAVLPAASVAEQSTVVVPRAKVEPDGGTQVTAGEAGSASAAVAANVTTAPAGPIASAVIGLGRPRTGGVVSHLCMVAVTATTSERLMVLFEAFSPEPWKVTEPANAPGTPATSVTEAPTVDDVIVLFDCVDQFAGMLIDVVVMLADKPLPVTFDTDTVTVDEFWKTLVEPAAPFHLTPMSTLFVVVLPAQTDPIGRSWLATGVTPSPSATRLSAKVPVGTRTTNVRAATAARRRTRVGMTTSLGRRAGAGG